MQIIPHFVLRMLAHYLPALLDWFSERIYADLIRMAEGDPLVELHDALDFAPLEEACAAYHHCEGPGARPTHTVPRLVRALLVQQLFHWSSRETEWHIRFNLIVKWFVGYPLYACGPDHCSLHRFEQWVDRHQHRLFFDETLRQIDADCPEERTQEQIGDTFALQANAARESLVCLLRHSCQRLLAVLREADPSRADQVEDALDHQALFGPEKEMPEYRLQPEERAARLQTTVLAALDCATQVRQALETLTPLAPSARALVELWLDVLHKVVEDNVSIERSQDAQETTVAELPKKKKGSYRLGSATDPEATYRKHRDDTTLGYNVQMAVSDNFVREIQAHTGAQPDGVSVPDLIVAQREHHDLTPNKLIYDAAAGKGKTLARVREVSDGQTQLVAPLVPYEKRTKRFTPDRFTLSDDGLTLTCPGGLSSSTAYRSGSGEGRDFRYYASRCRGCALWPDCRGHKPTSNALRKVFVSDFRSDVQAARAYNQTAAFLADRKRRPRVERFVATLVRYHGARHARRRGLRAADFQVKGAATALNLKRWVRLRQSRTSPAQSALEVSNK